MYVPAAVEILDREEREVGMFVVISTYRAKAGEEDAIIALHEDWQRNQGVKATDYLSWELLQKIEDPGEFIDIAHFRSKEAAQAAEDHLKCNAWYDRLMSLTEGGKVRSDYTSTWQLS